MHPHFLKKNTNMNNLTIAWWSGGITSAVACKYALDDYENVKIVYIETGSHHEDHERFRRDCEKWYGQQIEVIRSHKYEDVFDVIESTRYINGPTGARCTTELKKQVRKKFERNNDILQQVWGFEYNPKEINRAKRFVARNGGTHQFPLINRKINKPDAMNIMQQAGIEIPEMYKLGYHNSNCIGCVKGGQGYWNKIRKDFPEVFDEMSRIEQELGRSCLKNKDGSLFLKDLDPDAGRHEGPIVPTCGLFCESWSIKS